MAISCTQHHATYYSTHSRHVHFPRRYVTHTHARTHAHTHTRTHTHTHTHLFNNPLSRITRVGRYQKKHSPTHTHPNYQTSLINFLHLLASSMFNLHAWQSFSTTSVQDLFGLYLGLGPPISYFLHFFTQSSSSYHSACRYYCSLFCCNTNVMSSIPNLSLSAPYLENVSVSLTPPTHLTILISAR